MQAPTLAVGYAFLYPVLAEAARGVGYALALHGTMARDLDVVAIPWVEDPSPVETLVDALAKACSGYRLGPTTGRPEPILKPHGRLAFGILLEGGVFLDVSVMPTLYPVGFDGVPK